MAPDVAEILESVRALSPEQRADLAYQVLLTLDDEEPGVEPGTVSAAWREEIARRYEDYRHGTAEVLDFDESHAQLRAELAARHR